MLILDCNEYLCIEFYHIVLHHIMFYDPKYFLAYYCKHIIGAIKVHSWFF